MLRGNTVTRGINKSQSRRVTGFASKVVTSTEVNSCLKNQRTMTVVRKKTTLKLNLMNDYGSDIHIHVKKIESDVNLNEFLGKHSISQDYRAKMVDWMVEVLTTFKTSD